MKIIRSTVMMLAMIVAALNFTACGDDNDDDVIDNGNGYVSIVGEWECTSIEIDKPYVVTSLQIGDRLFFKYNGTYYWELKNGEQRTGSWAIKGNKITTIDGTGLADITRLTSTILELTYYGIRCQFKRISKGESIESLEGTWAGNMHISTYSKEKSYNSYETELTFINDPLTSKSGSGYWVDHYNDAPWDYVANHIEWEVFNNVIHIYLVEENTSLEIRDYNLNYGGRFVGKIYDIDGYFKDFQLSKTKTPDYRNYLWGEQEYQNKYLQLDKSSILFESSGGSDSFTITSNANWTISSDQTWCMISSSSGLNNTTVIVSVLENTSTYSRSATITVKAENLSQSISITQAGAEPVDQSTRTFTANGVSFKMIRVDGGTFTMGATSEHDSDANGKEKPAHQVTLSSYYIGETEVTQELWQAVMGSNPSYFSGSRKPVEEVSWDDCQEFIRKLNSLTGQSFRLPTEAEWEFAARGGNKSRGYAGSNTIDNVAWYWENSNSQTHNVANKTANELGLYDMSGNVWEWCQDWYGSYTSSSQTNPTGPLSGSRRVRRGGSWFDSAGRCRVSYRSYFTPADGSGDLGLRLAL